MRVLISHKQKSSKCLHCAGYWTGCHGYKDKHSDDWTDNNQMPPLWSDEFYEEMWGNMGKKGMLSGWESQKRGTEVLIVLLPFNIWRNGWQADRESQLIVPAVPRYEYQASRTFPSEVTSCKQVA